MDLRALKHVASTQKEGFGENSTTAAVAAELGQAAGIFSQAAYKMVFSGSENWERPTASNLAWPKIEEVTFSPLCRPVI